MAFRRKRKLKVWHWVLIAVVVLVAGLFILKKDFAQGLVNSFSGIWNTPNTDETSANKAARKASQ